MGEREPQNENEKPDFGIESMSPEEAYSFLIAEA